MSRIAIGGFQHETNTFSCKPSGYDVFVEADGWPGMTRGRQLFEALAGYNIGITGLLDGAAALGWEVVPLSWSYGGAGGKVTEDAFERISAMLLEDLARAGDIDGLLLDLHGAMVTDHCDDGEGELLRRIRALVGRTLPIVACLDLHANISEDMVAYADRLVAYRTYPHLDMAETGRRAARELATLIDGGPRQHKAFRQLPFLIPTTRACTTVEPARSIYDRVAAAEREPGVEHVSLACGFCPSDVPHCGPALLVYGDDAALVDQAADKLFVEILDCEAEFGASLWLPGDAVQYAMAKSNGQQSLTVLADVQDNYGGGAHSDSNWILAELARRGAENAVVGVLCDRDAAAAAHSAGLGADISLGLGGKSGMPNHRPHWATYRVEALGSGIIQSTGSYFAGGIMKLGPMALLRVGDIRVVVSTRAEQAADQAMFTHLGVDPAATSILVLKSSVHYRADFEDIASEILEVAAPAAVVADNCELAYRNLRPGLRIMPNGPVFDRAK
ncbi:MAG: M81 family metallopeptidase [Pseudomonadota bacterium]